MTELKISGIRSFLRSHATTLGTFILLFSATLFGYREVKERNEDNYRDQFIFRSRLAVFSVENRLKDYLQILKAAKGLYNSSDTVSREKWISFLGAFNLQRNYPGVQGIGFAPYIRGPEELDRFSSRVRVKDNPDFMVRPAGTREVYSPIVFLEPNDWRNQRAIGYDMFHDPIRREAMERARDFNQSALTGKVILVQETHKDVQAGFLFYLPVYNNDSIPVYSGDAERMIKGFVYSPFRAEDFASDIFQDHFEDVDIEIYDGVNPSLSNLLYNKDKRIDYNRDLPRDLSQKTHLTVAGRTWTIFITPKSGFWKAVNLEGPFVFLASGLVISLLLSLVAWSISKNKREVELKRTITDNASAGLFLLDSEGKVSQVNPAGILIGGYTARELASAPLYKFLDPIKNGEFTLLVTSDRDVREVQMELLKKNGKLIWCSISRTRIVGADQSFSSVLEIRDISQEKQARLELEESADRFRFLANAMPDKVWTATEEGKVAYYNDRWLEFIGKRRDEIHPDQLWDYIHPDETERIKTRFGTAVKNRTPFLDEFRLRDKDGTYRWHMVRAYPNLNEDNTVAMWVGATIDIDERKRQEEHLRRSASQISAINEELNDFASVVSHDLKAPLRAIGTLTDFLVQDCDYLRGQDKENLQLIKERVKRMEGLINGILRYSRIGREAAEYENIDLNQLVEEVIQYIKPPSDFIIQTGNLPQVNFIRIQMFQLFQNIIDNAIKYNDKLKGRVEITAVEVPEGMEISIKDNGPGVDPRYSQRIFKMFQTLTPRDKKESTGIGLTIVQKIIKGIGGRIWVESEKGQGTNVKFIVPSAFLVSEKESR